MAPEIGISNERSGRASAGMLRFVWDLPNLVTLSGLAISFVALITTIQGQIALGLGLVVVSIIIDTIDGALARRDPNRSLQMQSFGGYLDCFADFISKGVFPPLFLLAVGGYSSPLIAVALLYLAAIAIRYSYEFVPEAQALGLSPDYLIALLALVYLARDALGTALVPVIAVAMLSEAGLAIAPIRVPKLQRWSLRAFMTLLAVTCAALILY